LFLGLRLWTRVHWVCAGTINIASCYSASETCISAHNFPQHYLGAHLGLRDMMSYHLPCHRGASPQTTGRRSYQTPMDSLIWRRDSSFQQVGVRASSAQRNPLRCRNQLRSTALHTGKNLGSSSGLPQEAERETDHLPETASNYLLR
jgi:hypothetical protein